VGGSVQRLAPVAWGGLAHQRGYVGARRGAAERMSRDERAKCRKATPRATCSTELGATPLLQAAGFEPRFAEPASQAISPEIEQALTQMMNQQEPFPLTVLGGDFTIVRSNQAAAAVFRAFLAEPAFWERVARSMLGRLQRELLQRGGDARLEALLARTLAFPDVPACWKYIDLARPPEPTQSVRLRRGEHSVGFLIAVTTFAAPRQATLEELRVEACFPLDAATRRTCEQLAQRNGS
jgi:hypothetical protein